MNAKKLAELQFRINMCKFCLTTLATVDDADIRKQPAIEEYTRQLKALEARLPVTPKPPPTTIGLKTAVLTGKVPKIGG